MKLHAIDIAIIFGYLILTVLIGFWISKKASKNLDSYFLGGKSIPWYLLGVSNASGMFDITGTMWTVAITFVYGLKSIFIPWLWPVWNQIFLMIFLAIWLRRSNVLTGAEWLKTRFGENKGSTLSHIAVVIFALIAVIGFIAYAFEGIGKFATMFLPWDLTSTIGSFTIPSENMYALIIMGITTLYVIKGGMYSVVMTEVLQFLIMTVSCFIIGIIAINMVTPQEIAAHVPEGWKSLMPEWNLNLDWSNYIPELKEKISKDGYEMLSAFIMMMLFRGFLVSVAGPVPGYDMQRVLATKSPREAALMSGSVNLVLFFPRYLMIAGLAVLALVKMDPESLKTASGALDFELILPYALTEFIPHGALGLILAGLIAAFMSTFAANVNAGPAYIVNDIYKKFINPKANDKKLVRLSYLSSFAVVIIGITAGFFVSSINEILTWITSALFGGYAAANFIKWIWWRFNGHGYFWGMASGIFASFLIPLIMPGASPIDTFPVVLAFSTAGSLIGCLVTKPEDDDVLIEFYKNVRPWGFWGPVYRKALVKYPELQRNKDFGRDMFNCAVGIVWQASMMVMALFLVIRDMTPFWIATATFAATSFILKKNWYDRLPKEEEEPTAV